MFLKDNNDTAQRVYQSPLTIGVDQGPSSHARTNDKHAALRHHIPAPLILDKVQHVMRSSTSDNQDRRT
ncbi:hypothetical protein Slin15195_G129330 [Septoria linicola]|uniref:Uncharacterized protein n=1 Tax=Septoria linicola TaxID=215465 RepID=A0A9Q9B292_9PEZI|nr:hypothetical protein Slin14017_G121870 [Septoria linicola]USW59614.1 hypothetical protein Slin15195_G129330 [Septoria linicola]